MVELSLFVILAITSVAGAVTVIWAKNPVHAAMGLLGTLFSLAVIYVVNLAHLVAAVQVIVYAGAVMTLFLFVIMLIGVDKDEDRSEPLPLQRQLAIGLGVITLGLGGALAFGSGFQLGTRCTPERRSPQRHHRSGRRPVVHRVGAGLRGHRPAPHHRRRRRHRPRLLQARKHRGDGRMTLVTGQGVLRSAFCVLQSPCDDTDDTRGDAPWS
jgi:NADH:ubiquinone oxidoreductase subunit 6 (subunit J)